MSNLNDLTIFKINNHQKIQLLSLKISQILRWCTGCKLTCLRMLTYLEPQINATL